MAVDEHMQHRSHEHHEHHEHSGHSRPDGEAHQKAAAGSIWTCPMHPQIRRNEPGACPICGMALDPLTPTAD